MREFFSVFWLLRRKFLFFDFKFREFLSIFCLRGVIYQKIHGILS